MNRRDFLKCLAMGYMYNILIPSKSYASILNPNYEIPSMGNVRLLHITDTHAQLDPVYYREPSENIGVGSNKNVPPHIVSENFLKYYAIDSDIYKYAFTSMNFSDLAREFGKLGGYSYLKTITDSLKNSVNGNALLLDGGDTWQGSGLSLFLNGRDMVEASNILGVDVMTGHWEFTFGQKQFLENIKNFKGDFVAHNVTLTEEALFDGEEAVDDEGHYQKPYVIKIVNKKRIAIIGQAFPYTPIANPRRFVDKLTFGIKESELQDIIDKIITEEKPALIVLLSHNGVDVDKKLASRVSGIDIILGGHTHEVIPNTIEVIKRLRFFIKNLLDFIELLLVYMGEPKLTKS